jgi:hypothetical protein
MIHGGIACGIEFSVEESSGKGVGDTEVTVIKELPCKFRAFFCNLFKKDLSEEKLQGFGGVEFCQMIGLD